MQEITYEETNLIDNEQEFINEQFPELFCQSSNKATLLCSNQNCQFTSLICLKDDCINCQNNHKKCKTFRIKAVLQKLKRKRQKANPQILKAWQGFNQIFDKSIQQLQSHKDYIDKQLMYQGLNQYQGSLYSIIKGQRFSEVNGQLISKIKRNIHIKQQINITERIVMNYWKGKERQFQKIQNSLMQMLINQPILGFIIIDDHGASFATFQAGKTELLNKFKLKLRPQNNARYSTRNDNRRGDQKYNFFKEVSQKSIQFFMGNFHVDGILLAGNGKLKLELIKVPEFHTKLKARIVSIIDLESFQQCGLQEAIQKYRKLPIKLLKRLKQNVSQGIISQFLEHINKNDGLVVHGIQETMDSLSSGALNKIICWEGLKHVRVRVQDMMSNIMSYLYLQPQKVDNSQSYLKKDRQLQRVDQETIQLVQWLKDYGKKSKQEIVFVKDSEESYQFVKIFSGLGGFVHQENQSIQEISVEQ